MSLVIPVAELKMQHERKAMVKNYFSVLFLIVDALFVVISTRAINIERLTSETAYTLQNSFLKKFPKNCVYSKGVKIKSAEVSKFWRVFRD
jgi:ABC-type phosphate/phosphonate transport system permease subunit